MVPVDSDIRVLRRYYDLFNARKLKEAARLVAPDCEFEHVPTKAQAHGPRGYVALAEDWLRRVPDAVSTVESIQPLEPGIYRVRVVMSGTLSSDVERGRDASAAGRGRRFETRATQRIRVQDGLIVSARLAYDPSELKGSPRTAATPACPRCDELNIVVSWSRMHEQGLFCPICEHSWERNTAAAELS